MSSSPLPSPTPTSPPSEAGPSQPPQKLTILDAARTISPLQDLQKLPQIPCSRNALLFGIVAGASVGGLRFVFSRTARRGALYGDSRGPWGEVLTAANWAVGAWGVGSLGAWETCRARQTAEAAKMQALVADIKQKQAAKKARQEQLRAQGGVGGILVGEKGRELLQEREKQRLEGGEAPAEGKGDKSWWSGRV
ncbi:hypothetical protein JCM8547_005121 [Rhodosporidiobolus lusitaniae]